MLIGKNKYSSFIYVALIKSSDREKLSEEFILVYDSDSCPLLLSRAKNS